MFYKALYYVAHILLRAYYFVFCGVVSRGSENIPKSTAVIICGNHKSNNDGIALASVIMRRLNFIVKKEVFAFPPVGKFLKGLGLQPVDRSGADVGMIKAALGILKNGGGLVMFPEGTRHCKSIDDAKDGAVVLAIKTRSPILPVYIDGKYRLFSKTVITFGQPYELSEYYGERINSETAHRLTVELMNKIYNMR